VSHRGITLDRQRTTGTSDAVDRGQSVGRPTCRIRTWKWERGREKHIQAIGNFYYNSRPLETHTNHTYGYLEEHKVVGIRKYTYI